MPDQKLRPYKAPDGRVVYPGIITKVSPTHITILLYRGKLLTVRRTDDIACMPAQQVMYAPIHTVVVRGLDGYDNSIPRVYDASKDADVLNNPVLVHLNWGHNDNGIYVTSPSSIPERKYEETQARL